MERETTTLTEDDMPGDGRLGTIITEHGTPSDFDLWGTHITVCLHCDEPNYHAWGGAKEFIEIHGQQCAAERCTTCSTDTVQAVL